MKVFLLEDDAEAAAYISGGLQALGHQVHAARDGRAALADLAGSDFNVLILDRMVPGLDGLSVLRRARAEGCRAPALMLTARAGIEDRVEGLEQGADDYLVKPFAFAELAARVTALGRRPPPGEVVSALSVGDVEMDLIRRTVVRAGRKVDLQPREFNLLEQLMRHAGRVMTRTMLLETVWGFTFDPRTNIVETHMSRLRSKLNEGFETSPIRTVRGSGYVIGSRDD